MAYSCQDPRADDQGRDLMTATAISTSTSTPFPAGSTPTSSMSFSYIPEPSPTGFPPGPSIKTVTQTSTVQSPDSSNTSPEETGRGLAVGPPGAFSDSASASTLPGNMTDTVHSANGTTGTNMANGTNGTNGTVHHMTRLWNCTIIPSPSNSTGSGVDGTANCTLLDVANTNGTHANSTQLALESLISGNKTSSPSPPPSSSNSSSNSTATAGLGSPDEEEVEEEWEIVYECDEYETLPNTTTPSPSPLSSSAPTVKQAEVAALSSGEIPPTPVPAGQGSNGTIPLTPSPVNPKSSAGPAASSQPSGSGMDKMMNLSAGGSAMGGGGMPSRPLFIRDRLRSMRTRTEA